MNVRPVQKNCREHRLVRGSGLPARFRQAQFLWPSGERAHSSGSGRACSGLRSDFAIQLAVRRQRQRVEENERGWNHIIGQLRFRECPQFAGRDAWFVRIGDDVSIKAFVSG